MQKSPNSNFDEPTRICTLQSLPIITKKICNYG